MAEAEQLLEDVLEVQLAAPAEALGKRQRHSIAVVDMGKGVGIHRVLNMAADDTGEAVQRQHGTLAGAAAGDDIVGCAGVEQHSGQNTVLDIGQLGGILGGVHAVVDDLMAHRLDDLAQRGFDQCVLSSLTILIDQSDFHIFSPFIVVYQRTS